MSEHPATSGIEEHERSLLSLLRISDRLNSTSQLDTLLSALVEQVVELTDAETGCAKLCTAAALQANCPHDAGWQDWVSTHRTHYLTNDTQNDSVINPEVRERFKITSGMSIPVLDGKKDVIALFEVYNKKRGAAFTAQDLKNSIAAAQIASLAIQNGLNHRKLLALAAFSESLSLTKGLEQILEVVAHHLKINFHRSSAILLPADPGTGIRVHFRTPDFLWTTKELEAANRCWENGAVSDAVGHYIPITIRGQAIGVLGMESKPDFMFSASQCDLLSGFLCQTALAIDRGILEQKLRRLRFLNESDGVQNALLAAVSHEVRAPLAAITAAVSGLLSPALPLEDLRERELLRTAQAEAKRLHRTMNNLLNATRLQAGAWQVNIEPCDLSDVIGAVLEELGGSAQEREISIALPPDLPLVPMDFDLITQVLVNLFSNALKFSPANQPIELRSQITQDNLEVMVIDRGTGVPEGDLDRAFEKFHRLAESSSVDGLGLGLSICREFVEAHRGRIRLEHNPEGGTIARFALPVNA